MNAYKYDVVTEAVLEATPKEIIGAYADEFAGSAQTPAQKPEQAGPRNRQENSVEQAEQRQIVGIRQRACHAIPHRPQTGAQHRAHRQQQEQDDRSGDVERRVALNLAQRGPLQLD